MSVECSGTGCDGCDRARRHYLSTGCLVPNCVDGHVAATLAPRPSAHAEQEGE